MYPKELTKTTDFRKEKVKLPSWGLSPSIVPSTDVHSLFWVA